MRALGQLHHQSNRHVLLGPFASLVLLLLSCSCSLTTSRHPFTICRPFLGRICSPFSRLRRCFSWHGQEKCFSRGFKYREKWIKNIYPVNVRKLKFALDVRRHRRRTWTRRHLRVLVLRQMCLTLHTLRDILCSMWRAHR